MERRVMEKTIYECYYHFNDKVISTRVPSVTLVKEGFWVDDCHDYTTGIDGKYWIAPGAIRYVEKGLEYIL